MLFNVLSVVIYGVDYFYGEIFIEESISIIIVEDCKKYYESYFYLNLFYLVFVGDIIFKKVKVLVQKYFGFWKKIFVVRGELSKLEVFEVN